MSDYNKEYYKKNKERIKKAINKWRLDNREKWNESVREYYWKNVKTLRPKIAKRQRKYNAIKSPRILSNNPTAVYQREVRKKFKEENGISWNQIYRNGENALVAVKLAERKCQKCGSKDNLAIHHIDNKGRANIKKGLKPNNNLNNLIVLCRSCHSILHGEQKKKGV